MGQAGKIRYSFERVERKYFLTPQQQTAQMQRIQQYNILSESKNNSVQNTGWRNRKETTAW